MVGEGAAIVRDNGWHRLFIVCDPARYALDPCRKWVRFRARNVRAGTYIFSPPPPPMKILDPPLNLVQVNPPISIVIMDEELKVEWLWHISGVT